MLAEDKCKVCKELLTWAKKNENKTLYMEERVYAVSNGEVVSLVKAENPTEAMRKALLTKPQLRYISAQQYCSECDHVEVCRWYPHEGCEFRTIGGKTND